MAKEFSVTATAGSVFGTSTKAKIEASGSDYELVFRRGSSGPMVAKIKLPKVISHQAELTVTKADGSSVTRHVWLKINLDSLGISGRTNVSAAASGPPDPSLRPRKRGGPITDPYEGTWTATYP